MHYGTTFSHLLIKRLGRDPQQDLKTVIARGFHPIRLGIYWTEVEPQRDVWDFSQIASLLAICEKSQTPVILTIGAKAPRWPEYFIPEHSRGDWQSRLTLLHQKTHAALHHFSCIHWIQVENEPLDPSGPDHQRIDLHLVDTEVSLARSLWHKPVIINTWAFFLPFRLSFWRALRLADIVGIDLYYKVPGPLGLFYGPLAPPIFLLRWMFALLPKPVWIIELQGEPWRPAYPTQEEYHLYKARARALGVKKILIWGIEWELAGRPPDWSGAI